MLYTNVVEPILRWTFAERGYALVHAACLADGEDAFLITARTDTGKTTTSLKMLDSTPFSFLSDDLTLVTPDGRVLTYPKPLTISRHTLEAVKTPLLSRRERLGLVVQSRLHSRSGRRFALVLAKTHLPAATINAIVQLLVPPPKYHVERLVPGVEVAVEARLAGMVVIERGGRGEVVLDERRGARDPAQQLRGRLRLPAVLVDRGLPAQPQRDRPAATWSGRSWRTRSAGFRPRCSAARRWTGGSTCRAW